MRRGPAGRGGAHERATRLKKVKATARPGGSSGLALTAASTLHASREWVSE